MGVACLVGVIDPLANKVQQEMELLKARQKGPDAAVGVAAAIKTSQEIEEARAVEDKEAQEVYFKKQQKGAEDQKFRTVYMTGFTTGVTSDALRSFCENFGEVLACRVEEPEGVEPYGLVEFAERGAAHVVKTQQQYEVDGRVIHFRESKTMVNAMDYEEK